MRCAICNRVTLKSAAIIAGQAIGPTCYARRFAEEKKAAIAIKKQKAKRDKRTLDLFWGIE